MPETSPKPVGRLRRWPVLAVAGTLLGGAAVTAVALQRGAGGPTGCPTSARCHAVTAGTTPVPSGITGAAAAATSTVKATPALIATAASTTAATSGAGRAAGPTGGGRYPARFSVGAPGVGRYRQSDPQLPVPRGYRVFDAHNQDSKEWDLYDCPGTVNLDRIYFRAFIYLGTNCHGTVNITNSIIAPPPGSANRAVLVNANAAGHLTLNIQNTTIRPEPVAKGQHNAALTDHAINGCATCTIRISGVDVANTGGMCLCGANVTIERSWLHDNYIAHLADPSQAHTGGVFPYGGSGPVTISNSRLEPGVDAFTGKEVPGYWKAITAVLFTQSQDGSTLRNYLVRDSFISLGAFDLYTQDGIGLRLRDNVFGPAHWGRTSGCGSDCTVTFAQWSNNVVGSIDGTPSGEIVPRPS